MTKRCEIPIKYWTSNYTFKNRYELTGITDHILDHTKNSNKKLIILDVGCSSGIAMKYTHDYLKQKNIDSFTVGLDISKNVVEKAFKNLDKFIHKDLLDANFTKKFDIVICSKIAIFVTGDVRYKMIQKCSNLLKDEGILITDVGCFEKSTLSDEPNDFFCKFSIKAYFKNSFKRFYKEFQRIEYTSHKKDMKKFSKNEGLEHAKNILLVWNRFSSLEKSSWKFCIDFLHLAYAVRRHRKIEYFLD